MTFWQGIVVGWCLGMASFPFFILAVAWLLTRSRLFKNRDRRMSAAWLRERAERGSHVSPEAKRWMEREERNN